MPRQGKPLVSIITVVYNGSKHIEECIAAVAAQTYQNIEHIVVDGGSTDGTVDIIRRHDATIAKWITERDGGVYDGMNKGVAMVTDPESYVLFANADDHLNGPDAVERVIQSSDGEDLIYGKMVFTDGQISGVTGRAVTLDDLAFQTLNHPATFVRRRVFDAVGMFDTGYRIAADYDFIVRAFAAGVSTRFVDVIVSSMRMGGLSDDRFMLSCRERKTVIRRYFPLRARLGGIAHVNFYDIPRNAVRRLLARIGLLSAWRALRT
jgi:glycosyltransferase involved in cell wall biosynthesis